MQYLFSKTPCIHAEVPAAGALFLRSSLPEAQNGVPADDGRGRCFYNGQSKSCEEVSSAALPLMMRRIFSSCSSFVAAKSEREEDAATK